jgi:hypothetical protein
MVSTTTPGTAEELVTVVAEWPGVETAPHQHAGTAFRLGDREVGHVHRTGVLDIDFTRPVRDALVATGRADAHPVVPESGWTSFDMRTCEPGEAIERARWLLRLSYLYTALLSRETTVGRAVLSSLDVTAELDALDPGEDVRTAFDALLTGGA